MSSVFKIAFGRQYWLDGFAVTASVLCLIHCLLLPVLLVALPVLATMLTVPESFHAVAFALALPTSMLAMALGRRRHDSRWPLRLAVVGLALLGIGAFAVSVETTERGVSSLGAVLLAVAHVGNWRAMSHGKGAPAACPAEDRA
ncbi:MerC domain-containing protein [Sphingomonas sanguinis]|uniref:MerC domain-containing protein n=1 Tax=Sphingomonas sp. LC-1 TaxID=3110957 RepID=UPI0021BAE9DA|nr:MerC domain-containing protein [Sphingomonas sp. LC-1]MCT8002230.1 MerC domain-containing protein [Sphingomonas sp. LC-1]